MSYIGKNRNIGGLGGLIHPPTICLLEQNGGVGETFQLGQNGGPDRFCFFEGEALDLFMPISVDNRLIFSSNIFSMFNLEAAGGSIYVFQMSKISL